MVKRVKDDYLESYGGLIKNGYYLNEQFEKGKSLGIRLHIGQSFFLLKTLLVIEKGLRLLEKDNSKVFDTNIYKDLFSAIDSNFLIHEYFPLSVFSPYIELFLQKTKDINISKKQEILSAFKQAMIKGDFKKSVVRARKIDREKQSQLSSYIHSLFAYESTLLIIDLSLSYEMLNDDAFFDSITTEKIETVQKERNELITQLKKKYKKALVGYIWKLDYSLEKNFHYDMTFFLDGNKYQNDIEIVNFLEKMWLDITGSKGIYFSRNTYKGHGVGLIKYDELEKRNHVFRNALYLVKTDYFMRIKLKTENSKKLHILDRGQRPKRLQFK